MIHDDVLAGHIRLLLYNINGFQVDNIGVCEEGEVYESLGGITEPRGNAILWGGMGQDVTKY